MPRSPAEPNIQLICQKTFLNFMENLISVIVHVAAPLSSILSIIGPVPFPLAPSVMGISR